jgi:hypothetical protein
MIAARAPVSPRAAPPHALCSPPGLDRLPERLAPDDHDIEIGLALTEDSALHVAIKTPKPNVSPEMIDWWFAWHSDDPDRYPLWHPRAHVHAERQEHEIGYGSDSSKVRENTAIGSRIGFARYAVDVGFLIHQVRRTPHGAEMRSRFYVGGPHASPRRGHLLATLALPVAKRVVKATEREASSLLVRCSEAMIHGSSFRPALCVDEGEGSSTKRPFSSSKQPLSTNERERSLIERRFSLPKRHDSSNGRQRSSQ